MENVLLTEKRINLKQKSKKTRLNKIKTEDYIKIYEIQILTSSEHKNIFLIIISILKKPLNFFSKKHLHYFIDFIIFMRKYCSIIQPSDVFR